MVFTTPSKSRSRDTSLTNPLPRRPEPDSSPHDMNMPHRWSKRRAGRFVIAAALLLVLAAGFCAFLRISGPADIESYYGMAAECHPVWKQFALRRFAAGDSAAKLLRDFPPSDHEEFGPYEVYSYDRTPRRPGTLSFSGLNVVSRDGKLLRAGAGSCTWRYTFFHTEDAEFDAQYAAFSAEKSEHLRRVNRERLQQSSEAR